MKKPERWRPVVGYEGLYEVSNVGRVRGIDRLDSIGRSIPGMILVQIRYKKTHLAVSLCRHGRRRTKDVSHLVLEAFVSPRPPGMEACHWNDDGRDNRLENLRWGTKSDNATDRVRNGHDYNARKTHCPQGHEYSAANTHVSPSNRRYCRECARSRKVA